MTTRHLFNMPEAKGCYLIGLSGGPDSMALLDMCVKQNIPVAAAHVNYQARKSANRDEDICRRYCTEHGIDLHVLRTEFDRKGNFEDWARKKRFAFFRQLLKERGYEALVLAHHQNDHLETYLLQKQRGSVPLHWGLKKENVWEQMHILRPLLDYRKKDLLEYCENNRIPYGLDETNDSDKYARNRIRHKILSQYSPEDRMALLEEIEEENRSLSAFYERVKEASCCLDPFERERYLSFSKEIRLQALRRYLTEKGLPVKHVRNAFLEEIDDRIQKRENAEWHFLDRTLYLSYDAFEIRKKEETFCHEMAELKETEFTYFQTAFSGKSTQGVYVKPEDLPLTIRSPKAGDSIEMRFGKKRVSRFFIDRKIAPRKRKVWPVVENRDKKIILVPGLGCDREHYAKEYNLYVIPKEKEGILQEEEKQV